MDAFKDMSITDWLFFATVVLIWFYMVSKVYRWFLTILLRRGWRWWNRKDDKALAIDSFYEAFNIASLEPGHTLTAKTKSGLIIQVYRPKEKRDA